MFSLKSHSRKRKIKKTFDEFEKKVSKDRGLGSVNPHKEHLIQQQQILLTDITIPIEHDDSRK